MSQKVSSKQKGDLAEREAEQFLLDNGYKLVVRNYRIHQGEIDLVVEQDELIVFVEVRYRRNQSYLSPVFSVNEKKRKKLRKAALAFINHYRQYANYSFRFDIVGVYEDEGKLKMDHLENAFQI